MRPQISERSKEIKLLYQNGTKISELSRKFGLTVQRIDQIVKRSIISEALRYKIIFRDNGECQWCGEKVTSMFGQIHHIDSDPSNNDESNLILLCKHCHNKFHTLNRQKYECFICKEPVKKSRYSKSFKNYYCKKCLNGIQLSKKSPCILCGNPKVHIKNLCESCYRKKRYQENPSIKAYYRDKSLEWRKKNPEKWKQIVNKAVKKYQLKLKLLNP